MDKEALDKQVKSEIDYRLKQEKAKEQFGIKMSSHVSTKFHAKLIVVAQVYTLFILPNSSSKLMR